MEIALTIYHVIYIITGLIAIVAAIYKLTAVKLRSEWKEDIDLKADSIDEKIESKIKGIETSVTEDRIKQIVDDRVENKMSLLKQEMDQLKEGQDELKSMISSMQKLMIEIQLSLRESKPTIKNIERRLDLLEQKNG